MFDNIGIKIKSAAKAFAWIGIIASSIAGFFVMFSNGDTPLPGILIIIIGCLGSWLSALTLYGFGQLIENSDILVEQGKIKQNDTYAVNNAAKHQWRCNGCGNMISEDICPICNKDKIDTLNKWKKDALITEQEYNKKMEELNNEQH
ncbi:MAG: hypothetical protein IJF40_00170 [Clostridia bacterium]|nr:hypothetical protein [Clostridia bacterium]